MIHPFWAIDLWHPAHVVGFAIVATAFLLGVVHGITPDEHTWPITFSYAVGGYSSRRGLRTGLTFSLAFTAQRAMASELASLGLAHVLIFASVDDAVYLVVGGLMLGAGMVVVRRRRTVHFHLPWLRSHGPGDADSRAESVLRDPRWWMPAVHGFVAGWGFGAFAVIIYTVLAPAEHGAAWGWVPGACFGLGTTAVQAVAGASFGLVAARRGLDPGAVRRVALRTAGATLTWGGIAFMAAGAFGLLFPAAAAFGVATGLHVHNLDRLGMSLVLVIVSVVGVGLTTLVRGVRAEARAARAAQWDVPVPAALATSVSPAPRGAGSGRHRRRESEEAVRATSHTGS